MVTVHPNALDAEAVGGDSEMPALVRTRQISKHMQLATHLSKIGRALRICADDHNDKYQSDLNELVEKAAIDPQMFKSSVKPRDFEGPDYYIAGQDLSMYPGNFVAFENPEFCTEGVNVLHLDGHVEWMKPDMFMEELEATYKRLGREMPDIQFKSP